MQLSGQPVGSRYSLSTIAQARNIGTLPRFTLRMHVSQSTAIYRRMRIVKMLHTIPQPRNYSLTLYPPSQCVYAASVDNMLEFCHKRRGAIPKRIGKRGRKVGKEGGTRSRHAMHPRDCCLSRSTQPCGGVHITAHSCNIKGERSTWVSYGSSLLISKARDLAWP